MGSLVSISSVPVDYLDHHCCCVLCGDRKAYSLSVDRKGGELRGLELAGKPPTCTA